MLKKGMKINFIAKDVDGNDCKLSAFKGHKIISIFPQLNTRVCDHQTKTIRDWSIEHENITFISISADSPAITKVWCGTNGAGNSYVLSDTGRKTLGGKYNLLWREGLMKRGFIILDESNKVVNFDIGDDSGDTDYFEVQANFEIVEDFLAKINSQ